MVFWNSEFDAFFIVFFNGLLEFFKGDRFNLLFDYIKAISSIFFGFLDFFFFWISNTFCS